ncbi:hypothetical protein [Phytohabitans suffuscus]|uniref:Uncharacterized protein n=1 Tax=Phytohabitans suffuscus TaxID=624315 RepID=A0A6F8YLS1_9ACTN|nr:hypothetical protein [Phytohabitans suffuscus]BCB86996.1 hypothetical protein Psuf_043090 [Phytohabitans suffuscus]
MDGDLRIEADKPTPAEEARESAEAAEESAAKRTTESVKAKTSRRKPTPRSSAGRSKGAARATTVKKSVTPVHKSRQRSFPAASFEDACEIADTMQRLGAKRVRRLTLFEALGKSAESGPSRQMVTNSARYGITIGSYQADYIELTSDGDIASNPEADKRAQLEARFRLAIQAVKPFREIYEKFEGQKLPNHSVIRDFLQESAYAEDEISQCIDTFVVNAKYIGILKPYAGAERLLPINHVVEDLPGPQGTRLADPARLISAQGIVGGSDEPETEQDWSKVCFYVTPIGAVDSENRQHSDLFLQSIVEPALAEFGIRVVRADHIGNPGMITAQVIEHIVKSRIVVADLSFHNPNVFYELALRHACRKPVIQIIRKADRIPFDLDQVRTIVIDTSTIYTLVPQLETYRSEVAMQVRRAMDGVGDVENPLTVFYPDFWNNTVRG